LKTFWENAVQIAAFTAVPASQPGYGMAATNDDATTYLLTDAVSTFGTPYSATQESLRPNSANIAGSKDSFKCSARQLAPASPPSNSHNAPRINTAMASTMVATMVATNNGGSNSGGGGYNNGGHSDSYSNGGGGYIGGSGGGNSSNYGGGNAGGNGGYQTPSGLPPSSVKWYKN
jgi:hypothetical protein